MNNSNNTNATNQTEQLYHLHPEHGFIPVNSQQYTQTNNTNIPPFMGHHPYHMQQMCVQMQQLSENVANLAALSAQQTAAMIQNFSHQQNPQNQAKMDFSQERIDEIYTAVNNVAEGKAAPSSLLGLLNGTTNDFWKGLAVGAGAILLYNCSPLKNIVTDVLSSMTQTSDSDNNDFTSDLDEDGFLREEKL